jgi:hypothetical protein
VDINDPYNGMSCTYSLPYIYIYVYIYIYWGPLSLVNTIEDLLGRKNRGSGLENRDYDLRDPSR